MKGPNFTFKKFSDIISDVILTTRAFSIVITLTLINLHTQAQAPDCNIIMACNNLVNISLDTECQQVLGADMFLEAPPYGDEYYDIEARLSNGQYIPQLIVGTLNGRDIRTVRLDESHLGLTLEVRVTLRGCANSCWGYAKIEDKLPPVLEDCPCEERITSFRGNISDTDPVFNRPGACPSMTTVSGVSYTTHNFALTEGGNVNLSTSSEGVRFSVYEGSFDPSNPCDNVVATNVTSIQVVGASSGVNYILVLSSTNVGVPPVTGIDYQVFIQNSGGSVMSSIDASICVFECNSETTILAQTAANAPLRPTFSDACSSQLMYTKRDLVTTLGCVDPFSKIIRRTWTAIDASGNVSGEKVQFLYIDRPSLDDIECPADWSEVCGAPFAKLPNGAPTPAVSGQPTNTQCANIQFFYEDLVFEICGAGVKVNRRWTIIDWCTAEEKLCSQELRLIDDIAPVVTCPPDLTSADPINGVFPAAVVPVGAETCSATWSVIPPVTVADCSDITYDVFFKLADENSGEPPANTPFVKVDGQTRVIGMSPPLAAPDKPLARVFSIEGLPLGRTWIKYTVTDACGNSTDCFTEIDVVDRTPPTAICEDETVVSLDNQGHAMLLAEVLNNHSNDNCGDIVKFEVRRKNSHCPGKDEDLEFGPYITFCCSDFTIPETYVDVILRVYDFAGNFNDCESRVKIQNKRPPVLVCPPNLSLNCGDARISAWASGTAPFDTTFFGVPSVSGICSDLQMNSRIVSNNLNVKCGTGTVVREWFLVNRPSIVCRQTLTVTSPAFTMSDIVFPADRTLATCDITRATPDALNSRPIVSQAACRDIGITFVDQVFTTEKDACIKILRTWKVIDWCTYPSAGEVFERIQTIKLTGSGGAVFTNCVNQTFHAEDNTCEKEVTLSAIATDECTEADKLIYTWTLDVDKDNSIDDSGAGNSFTRVLPVGVHRVHFVVTNRCGTISQCSYDVTIKATKKPTPVCIREVVWVIDDNGEAEIWASDFNLKSEAACGDDSQLRFSFNAAGTQPERTFTCADIPNGQVARIPLQMHVIDEDGNSDFCDVILILQDSPLRNVCEDVNELLPSVGGKIMTENQEGVENIEVEMTNMNSYQTQMSMTSAQGNYMFTGISAFDPLAIDAKNDKDHLNGVSTLDLVMIQRHILDIQALQSPYKLIAADVNNSKSVTASDLVALRRLILGVTDRFDNNTSWRFIPAAHQFQDVTQPFNYPTEIDMDSIYEDKNNVNFVAVKVGDVNNSAVNHAEGQNTESRNTHASLVINNQSFESGKLVKVDVKTSEWMQVMGLQMALQFDTDNLTLSTVTSGVMAIQPHNYNTVYSTGGELRFSIDIPEGVQLNSEDVLFSIEFVSTGKGHTDEIKIAEGALSPELYEIDGSVRPIRILHRSNEVEPGHFALFQNEPNPFKDVTRISFELGQSSDITLRIADVTGKIVAERSGYFERGIHTMTFDGQSLGGTGVYYYQLETQGFSETKKMILIE